ncbi:hypothetical protein GOBAR_DD27004 [Gossypium barbadense]|nr:hypothetical protein GOBAR_DD27004 [Gossypium barbadense]
MGEVFNGIMFIVMWLRVVLVLRDRYKWIGLVRISIAKNGCSPLWRGISRGGGPGWLYIRLIHDEWYGTWAWERFNQLLSQRGISRVVAADVEDSLGWRWGSKRIFNIRSSCKVVALTISIADDGLLTNVERARHRFTVQMGCNSCGCPVEAIDHVLWKCCLAIVVWTDFGLSGKLTDFFELNSERWLKDWIKVNMDASVDTLSRIAVVVGVARDHNGRCLWGYTKDAVELLRGSGATARQWGELHCLIVNGW